LGYTLTVVLLVERFAMAPPAASAASFILWTPPSYLVHRDFTFVFAAAAGQYLALAKFAAAFVGRLAASAYTVHLLSTVFGLPYLAGVLANWLVLPLIGYLVMDFWVFRVPRQRPA